MIQKMHGYLIGETHTGVFQSVSGFHNENYPIYEVETPPLNKTILNKKINENLFLSFKYIEELSYSCSEPQLSDLLDRFFNYNDGYGGLLESPHHIEIIFLESFSFRNVENIKRDEGRIQSVFYMPMIPCDVYQAISDHFYRYFYWLLHEIYHVDDVYAPDYERNIINLEYSATKKSHCDFFLNTKFKDMDFSEKTSEGKNLKGLSEHNKGYMLFFDTLQKKVNSTTVLAKTEEHQKAKQWCLE